MPHPLYNYGPPVLVTGSTGTPATTTGEVEDGGGTSTPHTPPSNTSGNIGSVGSPSEEIVALYTPVLTTLTPATIAHGVADAVVTCTGTGFVAANSSRPGSTVKVNGVDQVTTFVSATSVTYVGKHSQQQAGGVLPVTVNNMGAQSASRNFTYT